MLKCSLSIFFFFFALSMYIYLRLFQVSEIERFWGLTLLFKTMKVTNLDKIPADSCALDAPLAPRMR